MRPDFRDFQGKGLQMLAHSAKGTTWKNHKYIKKEGDRYIYEATSKMTSAAKNVGKMAKEKQEHDDRVNELKDKLKEAGMDSSYLKDIEEEIKNRSETKDNPGKYEYDTYNNMLFYIDLYGLDKLIKNLKKDGVIKKKRITTTTIPSIVGG